MTLVIWFVARENTSGVYCWPSLSWYWIRFRSSPFASEKLQLSQHSSIGNTFACPLLYYLIESSPMVWFIPVFHSPRIAIFQPRLGMVQFGTVQSVGSVGRKGFDLPMFPLPHLLINLAFLCCPGRVSLYACWVFSWLSH